MYLSANQIPLHILSIAMQNNKFKTIFLISTVYDIALPTYISFCKIQSFDGTARCNAMRVQ